nr:hypothetical protein [Tanacetum cinerariifolium]
DEETTQEEEGSFDLIPRTPESEDESNDEDDQELRLKEDADVLYRDVNVNQGRGLQVTQNVEDSHLTLTPVNPDGPQESSSMSSFVTSMLNPTSDVGVESIFTMASSPIVSLPTPTPIMTPSTIAIITTSNLSEMELKKILFEKMEGNKSIQRSNEQRNLYKALVEAYDAD